MFVITIDFLFFPLKIVSLPYLWWSQLQTYKDILNTNNTLLPFTVVSLRGPRIMPGKPGCKNIRKGGDTIPSQTSEQDRFVTYVVYRSFKVPPPIRKIQSWCWVTTLCGFSGWILTPIAQSGEDEKMHHSSALLREPASEFILHILQVYTYCTLMYILYIYYT